MTCQIVKGGERNWKGVLRIYEETRSLDQRDLQCLEQSAHPSKLTIPPLMSQIAGHVRRLRGASNCVEAANTSCERTVQHEHQSASAVEGSGKQRQHGGEYQEA